MNNGTVPIRAERKGRRVIRLGDTTPDTAVVEINGRELEAWVISDAGYPQSVAAELDAAQQAYLKSRPRLEPLPATDVLEKAIDLANAVIANGPDDLKAAAEELGRLAALNMATPRFQTNPVTWEDYVTKSIMLMVPGITYEEADTMSPKMRNDLLIDLGYFKSEDNVQATGGTDQRPPEPEQTTSTGESPEPDSVTSIPA